MWKCPLRNIQCRNLVVICYVVDGNRLERYPDDELVLVVYFIAGALCDRLAVDQVCSCLQGSAARPSAFWNTVIARVPSLIA